MERWLEPVPDPVTVRTTREMLTSRSLSYVKEMSRVPEQDEGLFEREVTREQEVERSWDHACAYEMLVKVSDPWGETEVRGYCIGDKNHHGGHVPSTRTHMTREEILHDLLPDWEQRPF